MDRGTDGTGVIAENELYTLAELRRRMSLGKASLSELRKGGVPIQRFGRHDLILGRDIIAWLQRRGETGGAQ